MKFWTYNATICFEREKEIRNIFYISLFLAIFLSSFYELIYYIITVELLQISYICNLGAPVLRKW